MNAKFNEVQTDFVLTVGVAKCGRQPKMKATIEMTTAAKDDISQR